MLGKLEKTMGLSRDERKVQNDLGYPAPSKNELLSEHLSNIQLPFTAKVHRFVMYEFENIKFGSSNC